MVHVGVVQGFVAVEGAVLVHQVDHGNVACTVGRSKLVVGVLEHGDDYLVLVNEQANVVLLDAATKADGNTGKAVLFVFLHQVLDFGHVALAVGALGAEIVNQQGAVGEVAKENARIADANQRL